MRESEFQRQDRIDREFEALEQGRKSFSEFRSLWEEKLAEMQFNNLQQASCEGTLYRKFLGKITHDLRNAVLTRTWQLDEDPSVPPRKPKTWEEVADAIEQELATRADVKAPTE